MEYIIVFDRAHKRPCVMENNNNTVAKYASYEDAKKEGELWKRSADCISYDIYKRCSNTQ